jgi:N-succinyl-L-ornithine transcarbamylase
MKHFTSAKDVQDINALIKLALEYKQNPLSDQHLGRDKRIGLLFLNPSLRTRLSTQLAARNLGMEPIVFNMGSEGWQIELEDGAVMNGTSVEHIKDAAPVLGAYFDVLCVRTFPGLKDREADYNEPLLRKLIQHANVPVVSLESATLHPLQSLADLVTITESFKEARKPKVVLTWAPHIKPIPQCVANSFAEWMNTWQGADFVITHPEGYELATEFSGGAVVTHNQAEALQGADFIYVKNWSSFQDYGKVLNSDASWMLTQGHLQHTNNAKVMHCLPVRRNVELSDEILDSASSIVTQQAGNRLCAAQAVLSEILKSESRWKN